ncbi:hypothetical protein DV515_00008564 [Chloebia gouldiae]|uniref:Uncharacterized protein n=1 Tax=Chloebia gouldiae TaxID=44316 RepID=A0A3L8SFJ2_CHLGU|nr:hypothetical protein DV515_00008564 [Chloebia gouldiae]
MGFYGILLLQPARGAATGRAAGALVTVTTELSVTTSPGRAFAARAGKEPPAKKPVPTGGTEQTACSAASATARPPATP